LVAQCPITYIAHPLITTPTRPNENVKSVTN
jgi:hypothetical protein